jgi:signal transduction histidine kinase
VYGERATPYEVLSEFTERMVRTFDLDDILPRMARILGEGTGAARAEIWLRVGETLRRSAAWPPGEGAARDLVPVSETVRIPGSDLTVPVRHHGELLGALVVASPRGETITPAQEQLVGDLASQAGLVVRNVRLVEELRASRQRIVSAQDEERRRIERNIHDGAQQSLVALAVKLRLARTLAGRDPAKAEAILDELQGETQGTLENLRDLARGIYPPLLADKGLPAAVEAQARKTALPVSVEANSLERYSPEVEAGVYFCVLEALQNAAKYADASRIEVRLWHEDGTIGFAVEDDGRGFDPRDTPRGTGLRNMGDRVAALGGDLDVRSSPRHGTTVSGRVPVRREEAVR